MALFELSNVKIDGIAACVPKEKVSNAAYNWISEKERALLVKTTGIAFRRKVASNQCASDLCLAAAQKLLNKLQWQKEEIDILIFVSQTPDYITPATATILQHKLGLGKHCLAFDVNLGCSAYVYGLSIIAGLLGQGFLRKGLLLVGDAITKIVSEKDKSIAPLFSDAGTATAISFDANAPDICFNLQSDGKGSEAIIVPHGGGRQYVNTESLVAREVSKGIVRADAHIKMNGLQVFNFALKEVVPNVQNLLAHLQLSVEDFDYFVFHQANLLLNERIRKKLKIPAEKVPYSLKEYGNTNSATIPLTIVSELQNTVTHQKLQLLLAGFGVGLSWGSAVVALDRIVCPPIFEV